MFGMFGLFSKNNSAIGAIENPSKNIRIRIAFLLLLFIYQSRMLLCDSDFASSYYILPLLQ